MVRKLINMPTQGCRGTMLRSERQLCGPEDLPSGLGMPSGAEFRQHAWALSECKGDSSEPQVVVVREPKATLSILPSVGP
ncbi:hypothetical protein M758_7G100100 [Ceratodon purpureus]|nr:hypothetical protein M758_7G100100 [Ceratodon purpureus]